MDKNIKIIIGIIIAIAVIAIGYGIYNKSNQPVSVEPAVTEPVSEESIKIGFIAPLTGDAAIYGEGEKNAVEMAVEEINATGGINGQLLQVIYEDGKCTGKDAVMAATKLINIDKVKIILGGACSGETLAIAPLIEENKIILFSAFSGSPDITNAGDFIFRNSPSDIVGGKDLASVIYNDGIKKVAMLSENTDYAQALRKVFKEEFVKLGGEIVADELYTQDAKDYRTQLTKIKATTAEAIFFNNQTGVSAGLSVKQARELGIDVPYYGFFAFDGADAFNSGGDAINGVVFVTAPGLSQDNAKAVSFFEKFQAKYPAPGNDYQVGARYDSVYIIADALKKCGQNTECIRDYLYNLKEYDGTIGKYGFDKNGDLVGIKYVAKKIVDGKAVPYEE